MLSLVPRAVNALALPRQGQIGAALVAAQATCPDLARMVAPRRRLCTRWRSDALLFTAVWLYEAVLSSTLVTSMLIYEMIIYEIIIASN